MIPTEPLLLLRDLEVVFGGIAAVDNLGFALPSGSIVSLIGPNGAGKTTALNAISGFVPARGSVRFQDREILALPAYRRAALGIGRTFQNLQLFTDMSVTDNLLAAQHVATGGNVFADILRFPAMRRERMARSLAHETLRNLGLLQYAGRRPADLPFGIQALVGVARALAGRPRLLLMDEPATGLNRSESDRLGTLIVALRREFNFAVLLVEHNMRLVMDISDRIVVMDAGRHLAAGTPAEIAGNPEVIRAYLGGA